MSEIDKARLRLSPAKRALLDAYMQRQRSAEMSKAGIPRRSGTGPAPLSFAQQRQWFLNQYDPQSAAANMPVVYYLDGALNQAALVQAVNDIVRRHETLRTTFAVVDGEPVQVVAPMLTIGLEEIDLSWQAGGEEAAMSVAEDRIWRPFDLTAGPLLRLCLIRLAEKRHLLVLVMHHIISDGWSVGILFRELLARYEALVKGEERPLSPLPIQYADFAAWQRTWLESGRLQEQMAYWRKQLGGELPVLELPTDRPRPAVQSYKGGLVAFDVPRELTDRLKALSRGRNATLFMTLLAAFQALLSRYTGLTDLTVGTPIANRPHPETEALIGFFANTLVMRTDLSGEPTFAELLGRVRDSALEAFANQDVPFEMLVQELQPERDMSRSPLFQVMFILQNASDESLILPGLKASPATLSSSFSLFDLTLSMKERPYGLQAEIYYSTDLFDRSTIERLVLHYITLLAGAAANPDGPVARFPLMPTGERERILREWNDTKVEYPAHMCVHQLFEQQAERSPDRVAVVCEGTALSYGELNARANRLAHHLRRLGVGRESLVGICLERTPALLVGLLAILKAGAAYVPLDPLYPAERLAFMLEDAGVKVLLTESGLAGSLPEVGARLLQVDADAEAIALEPESNPESGVAPSNLAYVIYTSGSTGKPKGVQVEHRNLVNFLWSIQREPGMAPDDVLLAVTSVSFDIAGLELYLPLITGGRLILAHRETTIDGAALQQLLTASGATVMQATPATWRLLLEAGWRNEQGLRMLIGGEELPRELAARLLATGGELWNLYGPTETTVWSAIHRVEQAETAIPIGRPIGNTEIYLLDAHLQPQPAGVVGELYIGGDGVARGYLNRPDLTEERFIPHPFRRTEGARLYKTGDLARYLPDGTIAFLGRVDHQVKIRGFRIELGEVEAALNRHPAVAQAVAVAHPDGSGELRLVAYLVSGGADLELTEVRSFLQTQLPSYMVPSVLVPLEALPLTPNGKVDRKALPAPEVAVAADIVAPRTAVEEVVAALWCEVLDIDDCSIYDNFFDLGGHSLLATKLIRVVGGIFQVNVPLRALFESPTVAGFSDQLLTAASEGRGRVEQTAALMIQAADLSEQVTGAALESGEEPESEGVGAQ